MIDLNVAALEPLLVLSKENGSAITMAWGGETRAFVVKDAMDDMPVENYYHFNLLNKELSFDIDMSTVGCSCNAALFFTSMPGYNPNGTIAHGAYNPYYCDANDVGGVWCWEHDTIEANMHTMATTPHRCSAPAGAYIPACDGVGCSTNAFSIDAQGMCPDAKCTIDTRSPFRMFQKFEVDPISGNLSRVTNRFVQGDSVWQWDVCHDKAWYVALMTSALSKVTMVFQLWGDTFQKMFWLDNMTGCTSDCNSNNATVTFSNIEIASIKSDPAAYVV